MEINSEVLRNWQGKKRQVARERERESIDNFSSGLLAHIGDNAETGSAFNLFVNKH